jgi:hypothetical protein
MYEMLGSVAFALDLLSPGSHVRLLENVCIPADGKQQDLSMRSRDCTQTSLHGKLNEPHPVIRALLLLLGVGAEQTVHYPYVRQWEGPSVHLDRATFDCSPAIYRHFWHSLKLREVLRTRLRLNSDLATSVSLGYIVILDRNSCRRSATSCKRERKMRRQKEISAALERRFAGVRTIRTHTGDEPLAEQAQLFNQAAVAVGPHGGAFSNIIFCATGAHIVEYIASKRENSALYMAYASAFGLEYWVVVSDALECRLSLNLSSLTRASVCTGVYDGIEPLDVVETVQAALRAQVQPESSLQPASGPWVLLADQENFLVDGYGKYTQGYPTGW